jgi:hypothetical protein
MMPAVVEIEGICRHMRLERVFQGKGGSSKAMATIRVL